MPLYYKLVGYKPLPLPPINNYLKKKEPIDFSAQSTLRVESAELAASDCPKINFAQLQALKVQYVAPAYIANTVACKPHIKTELDIEHFVGSKNQQVIFETQYRAQLQQEKQTLEEKSLIFKTFSNFALRQTMMVNSTMDTTVTAQLPRYARCTTAPLNEAFTNGTLDKPTEALTRKQKVAPLSLKELATMCGMGDMYAQCKTNQETLAHLLQHQITEPINKL